MRASGRPICAAPLEGIPSTVPLHDALFLYGEAVQSNPRFCVNCYALSKHTTFDREVSSHVCVQ